MARPDWTVDAPVTVVNEATAMLDAGHAARSVYRRLDLARYCERSTFGKWATRRAKVKAQQPAERRVDARGIFSTALESVSESLASGALKPNQVVGALSVLRDVLKLEEIEKPKEERDSEKHAKWRTEAAAVLKAAADAKTEGGKTATREEIYDMINRALMNEL